MRGSEYEHSLAIRGKKAVGKNAAPKEVDAAPKEVDDVVILLPLCLLLPPPLAGRVRMGV
jgi:hypothetical protein